MLCAPECSWHTLAHAGTRRLLLPVTLLCPGAPTRFCGVDGAHGRKGPSLRAAVRQPPPGPWCRHSWRTPGPHAALRGRRAACGGLGRAARRCPASRQPPVQGWLWRPLVPLGLHGQGVRISAPLWGAVPPFPPTASTHLSLPCFVPSRFSFQLPY